MGRYAPIQRKIWTDDRFPFLSDDLKLVWFHLLTTPFSTPHGLICASAESLASEMRWNADRYKKRLREGEDAGLWMIDEKRHVVYFRNFWKHNKPENPSVLVNRLSGLDEFQPSRLALLCLSDLREYCTKWGENYLSEFERVIAEFEIELDTSPDTCTDTCSTPVTTTETETENIGTANAVPCDRQSRITSAAGSVPFKKILDLYNAKCTRLRKIKTIDGKREIAVSARYKSYGIKDFEALFEIANASDFLCGSNGKNWSADFDWLMKATNMAKVLEGNYDNRASSPARAPAQSQSRTPVLDAMLAKIEAEEATNG